MHIEVENTALLFWDTRRDTWQHVDILRIRDWFWQGRCKLALVYFVKDSCYYFYLTAEV